MTNVKAIDRRIDENLPHALEELAQLCAQPSISAQGRGIQDCAELVAEMLASRGFEVQIMPTDGFPVVYAERSGRGNKTLLFYNHYDVQPPEPLEAWHSPPFEATLRDGKLYARGVSDDKGHLQCRLAALDAFLMENGELPCNVKFVVEGEEEIGSIHLESFVHQHRELLAADACVWEMGRVDDQGRPIQDAGMRGMLYVELRARSASRDAHSGIGGSIFPNAAWRLTWALQAIKASDGRIRIPGFYDDLRPPSELDLELLSKLPDEGPGLKEKFGVERFLNDVSGEAFKRQYLFEPTCTIGGLTAGYQGPGAKTVLPAEASAKMDFRLLPDQHPDFIYSAMREHLNQEGFEDIELIRLAGEPPARTPPDDPFLQLVVQSAAEVYGTPQRISPLHPGSGPMHAFIQALGIPVAMAGFGYPGTLAHSPNENMVIDYFVKACKHTARVMMHL